MVCWQFPTGQPSPPLATSDMGKDNKARRKQKAARRAAQRKRQRQKLEARKRDQTFAPTICRVPHPFEGLSDDQRRSAIQRIAEYWKKQYNESLNKLRNILHQYDPLLVLSLMSYYGLSVPVNKTTGVIKRDSDFDIYPCHIEILQALCLQIEVNDLSSKPLMPDVLKQIRDHVKKLCDAHSFRHFGSGSIDSSDNKKPVTLAQLLMRGTTQNIRNWGYYSQVQHIARELYCPFDAELLKARGFSVSSVINIFDAIYSKISSKLTTHQQFLANLFRESGQNKKLLIENYHLLIGLDKEEADQFIQNFDTENISLHLIHSMIISHYDLRLSILCTFSSSDLTQSLGLAEDQVIAILDEYSLGWGALREDNTEHFHLSNPVWTKPVIKLDDGKYFCALPFGFSSFVIPCIESLLSPFGTAVNERRAEYLESKVAEIVETRFPDSRIKRNFKWVDGERTYETDLIIFIDSFALLIECKSGKITPPARRGAPDRLRKSIQNLLVAPNLQSLRLKKSLEFLSSNPDETDRIRDEIGYDLNKVHKIVRASVCLEDFGSIQSCLPQFKDTQWLPADFEPCPTMNLADFETIFDILEHPIQILHYLIKREMIEASFGYLADELDLLGLYLTTLLDRNDSEHDVPTEFLMIGMSSSLDDYYNSVEAGVSINKPRPKISPLFAFILFQLEQQRPPRWMEIGIALLMFSPDEQMEFTNQLMEHEKKVHQNWRVKGHKNILFYTPSKTSSYALSYVMYKSGNAEQKRNFMEVAADYALQSNHVQFVVVVAKNIDKNDLAYHAIALCERLKDTPE